MTQYVTPKTLALVLVAVIALLAAGGWFGLIASQRSTASSLESQTADEQANLESIQALVESAGQSSGGTGTKNGAKGATSQPALLAVAFPTTVAMPSVLLQVQRLANRANVDLDSFAPSMPTPLSGYDSIAIDVTVTGRYRAIQKFVHDLRTQAGSSGGRVHASGRLFAVQTVGITTATEGLPLLSAAIRVDAYAYSGVALPTEPTTETSAEEGTS